MAERYQVVIMRSNGWKLPFNLALGIHILILLGAMYLPGMFKAKPKFADIYSVSLVNVAEIETAPPVKAEDPGPPKIAAKPPPPPPKKQVSVEEPKIVEPAKEVPVAETPAPPKVVSLKPLKQKKVITKEETPPKKPEVDRKQLQKLAQAIREEEILEEKARLAREALEQERKQLAETLKASQTRATAPSTGRQSGSPAQSASSAATLIEKQYYSEILNRLLQFWSVPEYLQKELETVVFLTIDQDGGVVTWEIDSSSGDRLYDQFVSKTIEAAKPFPPIPPAMKTDRVELGLRFKPGSIQ